MDYLGIGFSNIRLPNSSRNYTYQYNYRINTFPEEVFIHEFLHTLERVSKDEGYDVPALHDYLEYGYETEEKIGLKTWYIDYMNCKIEDNESYIGLNSKIYFSKPLHASNFANAVELEFDKDSNDFIVRTVLLLKKLGEEIKITAENISINI